MKVQGKAIAARDTLWTSGHLRFEVDNFSNGTGMVYGRHIADDDDRGPIVGVHSRFLFWEPPTDKELRRISQ